MGDRRMGYPLGIHGLPSISKDIHWCQWTSWVSMDIHGYSWNTRETHGCPWISRDSHGFLWISIDIHGNQKEAMDIHRCPWASIDIHGSPWIVKDHRVKEFPRNDYRWKGSFNHLAFFWKRISGALKLQVYKLSKVEVMGTALTFVRRTGETIAIPTSNLVKTRMKSIDSVKLEVSKIQHWGLLSSSVDIVRKYRGKLSGNIPQVLGPLDHQNPKNPEGPAEAAGSLRNWIRTFLGKPS